MNVELVKNIDICLRTRELGAKALLETLKYAKGKKLSEKELADIWQSKVASNPHVFDRGWYEPPPNGFSVLVHDEAHPDRLDFTSLRVPEMWSQSDIIWNDDQAAFFYCSPVDKNSGIIGDFCVTLFKGGNQNTVEHFRKCYSLAKKITDYAQIGMTLGEVYDYAASLFDKYKVRNTTGRIYDDLKLDIGHTIPWTNELMTNVEADNLINSAWDDIKNMIRKKRKFVEHGQDLVISENTIFTIEERLKSTVDSSIPTPTFHFLVVFRDGKKSVVDNFKEIFDFWGMDYLN